MRKNKAEYFKEVEKFQEFIKGKTVECYTIEPSSVELSLNVENEAEFILANNLHIPANEAMIPSFLNRCDSGCGVNKAMSDEDFIKTFEINRKYVFDQSVWVKVMVIDGQVVAVNSKQYAHIPLEDIFDTTVDALESFFTNDIKIDAEYSYSKVFVKFLCDKRREFNGKSRKIIVTLTNSENGSSAVKYGCYLSAGKFPIPLMNDIEVIHKGDEEKRANDVYESISMLETALNNKIKALRYLEKIEVHNVITTIRNIGKRCSLAERYIEKVVEKNKNKDTCLASEIYMDYAEAIADSKNKQSTYELNRNNVLKMIGITDWSKYED